MRALPAGVRRGLVMAGAFLAVAVLAWLLGHKGAAPDPVDALIAPKTAR